ncbi:MAG: hydroxyacid dehydrogenase [Oscillospiraceae bacterium]|nr:hydroxyacid dehydrogenase [Clostridiales bacterium]MDD7250237.1 hydroxyacid dehydrogenase [Clostridiales bacterium]MDY2718430.1 hydroxyacid dehydrogenase [Oscillospiraceae bacterium]
MKFVVTMPEGPVFETFWSPDERRQLEALGEVQWNTLGRQFTPEELAERLRGAEVCVTGWGAPVFDERVLSGADALRLIAHTGGSVKPYVTDLCYQRGIRVLSGNRVFAESVAEGVIAYALASLRRIPLYATQLQHGYWNGEIKNRGLLDRKVGIVGYGMIARDVIEMLRPFHCPIAVYSRHLPPHALQAQGLEQLGLEELFAACDVISLHSGMTPENHHLVTQAMLRSMKPGALLINTARGALIDEAALCRVLAERPDLSAALDVYETEPLPEGHPLQSLDNVLLMPHMGGPTIDRRRAVTKSVLGDIRHFLAGEPLSCEISRSYAEKMSQY